MNLNNLRLKRGQIVDQMKSLLDQNPHKKWTPSIEAKYREMDKEQQTLKAQIDRTEKQERLDKELNGRIDDPVISGIDDRAGAGPLASLDYQDAFMNLMRVGKGNLGHDILNALQVGAATEGGNIVPTELDRGIVEYLQDFNEFRNRITVIKTSSDRDIPVETTLGSAAWTAEEAAYNESDAVFGKVSLSSYKLTRIIKASEELVMDSIFNLTDYLARNFGKAFGNAEEAAIVAGSGSGQPTGFVGAASTGVTAAATTTVTADEIIDLYHSLSKPYRRNAVFSMADASLAKIRKLADSNGQYLWQPGLQAGEPDMILGKPVIATTAQPAMTTGLDAISIGDLSYYYLAERSGRVMQVLIELYAGTGQIGYRGYERIDGALVDTNSVKNLTMA